MRRGIAGAAAAALLCGAAAVAEAGTVNIDFNDGTAGNSVGSTYSSQGVVFSNAQYLSFPPLPGGSPPMRLGRDGSGGAEYNPTSSSPIVMTFAGLGVSEVSILALDLGQDDARLVAYDSAIGGNVIDTHTIYGTGNGAGVNATLSVSGFGIKRVELFQPNDSGTFDGVFFDDLSFTPIAPLPSAALLGFGMFGALGALRARRRAKQA
jgi:hypothetical protein